MPNSLDPALGNPGLRNIEKLGAGGLKQFFERNAIFAGPKTFHSIETLQACNIQPHSIEILFERLCTYNSSPQCSLTSARILFQHASIHMMLQEGSEFFPSTLVLRHCWQAKYSDTRKSGTPDLKSTHLVLRHCHNPRTGSCNAVAPSSAAPHTQTLPKQLAPLPRLKAAVGRNLRPRLPAQPLPKQLAPLPWLEAAVQQAVDRKRHQHSSWKTSDDGPVWPWLSPGAGGRGARD